MAEVGIIYTCDSSQKKEEAINGFKERIKRDYKDLDDFLDREVVEIETVRGFRVKD